MNENNVVKCIVEPKNAVTLVANEVDGFQHDGLCFSFLIQTVKLCFIIDIFMGPHNHVICF